jgi:hypothetical protein
MSSRSSNRPSANYIGTGLFLSYILAALILTARRAWKIHDAGCSRPERRILGRVLLAVFTFLVMSANMISVLADSYVGWAHAESFESLIPDANLLWKWMIGSTLFADFAEDLTSSPAVIPWSQLGLLWTFGVTVWMTLEGRRKGVDGRTMAELLAIGQILPVSSAMQMLMLETNLREPVVQKEQIPAKRSDYMLFYTLNIITVSYISALLAIESLNHAGRASSVAFFIALMRGLLVIPYVIIYLLPISPQADLQEVADSTKKVLLAGSSAVVARQMLAALEDNSLYGVLTGWNANAPVQTLIVDMALGLCSTAWLHD